MLRAAGIDWAGCTLSEERQLEAVARRRLQVEDLMLSLGGSGSA